MFPALTPNLTPIELIKLVRSITSLRLVEAKYLVDYVIPDFAKRANDTEVLRSFIRLLVDIKDGKLIVEFKNDKTEIIPSRPTPFTLDQIWERTV